MNPSLNNLRWLGAMLLSALVTRAETPAPTPAEVTRIPDAHLELAIRLALNKTDAEVLTILDVQSLTALDASEQGLAGFVCCRETDWWGEEISTRIDSLEGLQFATNLISLNLSADGWSHDGGPDAQLSGQIDFPPLAALTKLETLNLSENWPTNDQLTASIAGLTRLRNLDLEENRFSDGSFLTSLTNLSILNLYGNPLTNWSALRGLTNLEELTASADSLSEVTFLSGFTQLRSLSLWGRFLSTIVLPEELVSLETLVVDSDRLPISRFSNHCPACDRCL
jgi:hypothetical protein